jgi:hypothetical protein
LKSGVRLLVEILITACKLMSVKEHLYLLLLIFKQEKLFDRAREGNLGSRWIFLTVLAGDQKIKNLSGPLFAHPWAITLIVLSLDRRVTQKSRVLLSVVITSRVLCYNCFMCHSSLTALSTMLHDVVHIHVLQALAVCVMSAVVITTL